VNKSKACFLACVFEEERKKLYHKGHEGGTKAHKGKRRVESGEQRDGSPVRDPGPGFQKGFSFLITDISFTAFRRNDKFERGY